jgi:hypothetical protein
MPTQDELDTLCIQIIRTLCIDAVQKARSGLQELQRCFGFDPHRIAATARELVAARRAR